jgi:hypothetical protein
MDNLHSSCGNDRERGTQESVKWPLSGKIAFDQMGALIRK